MNINMNTNNININNTNKENNSNYDKLFIDLMIGCLNKD